MSRTHIFTLYHNLCSLGEKKKDVENIVDLFNVLLRATQHI